MRRLTFALAMVMMMTGAAFAHDTFNVSGDDCSRRNFQWDDYDTVVARETIDGRALRSIKTSVKNAPVSVIGDSSSGYSIEVCKAATTQADLDAIRVRLNGDELQADGPENRRWHVQYRIHVPRGANVDVTTRNGPLSLHDVNGTVVAHSSNGPLSLKNVSGDVEATTKNGPIDIEGGSGNMKVSASNGPLSIDLDGNAWLNGSLEASTRNGPLSINIPRGYNSGVVVESSGRGPFSCRAEGCRRYDDDDDEDTRRVELGNGRQDVRVSTVNGPVTIRDAR